MTKIEIDSLPLLEIVTLGEANCADCPQIVFATCPGDGPLDPGTEPDSPECCKKRLAQSVNGDLSRLN